MIALRPATAEDALLLATLGAQVFVETYAPDGLTHSLAREVREHFDVAALASLLATPDVEFMLAEREGHTLGFLQMHLGEACPVDLDGPARAEVQRIYVLRSAKGQGVGKALMRHAQERAAQASQRFVWLSAWVGNAWALRFYALQGFADVGTLDYVFEGQRFENRVLAKPVA